MLNEPRDGKKLLVLDIDYTLFGKCPTNEKRVKDLKIDMINEPREGGETTGEMARNYWCWT